ncbi:hypothetical protein D3C72_1858660 [compost metagenome]
MLTPKGAPGTNRPAFGECDARLHRISGGASDSEANEFTVKPTGRPCAPQAPMTATPVA